MPEMDEEERRTREARLLVSWPEAVFGELKRYAAQAKAEPSFGADEQLEKSLAERADLLIDLGLACYGSNKEIVGALYRKGLAPADTPLDARYRKGLRIACLSNKSVPVVHSIARIFEKFPDLIIGSDETRRVLAEADGDEVGALICNPHVSDSLLQALYERSDPFSQFDEERWRGLVVTSRKNSRLVTRNDDESGPDLGHRNVQRAIFKLLETAPATGAWLHSLYYLLDSLDPQYVASPDKIDDVLERWGSVAVDDYKGNPAAGLFTSTPLRDEFRCIIAALYGRAFRDNKSVILGSASAPDVALRCAYYGNAQLTAKETKEGHERDRDVFVFAALFNDHVYLTPSLRKLLEEEYLTGNLEGRYRRRCERLHKRYRNFDPRPAAEWMTQHAAEDGQSPLGKLTGWAATMDTKAADLAKQVRTIKKWLVWGFLIIGALFLFRR
jgi:hypothetical protein